MLIFWVIGGVTTVCGVYYWSLWRQLARAEFIRSYNFPRGLLDKLQTKRPELDVKQMQLVTRALRQFFLAHLLSGRKFVSMPSQVTDDLWHEFILFTREYDTFCQRYFGRYIHHTPKVTPEPPRPPDVARFVQLYELHFGPLPDLWEMTLNDRSRCSGCNGCSS